jgi:hypothetical protein
VGVAASVQDLVGVVEVTARGVAAQPRKLRGRGSRVGRWWVLLRGGGSRLEFKCGCG